VGERLIVGLMSGTSVDAVDAALVRIRGGAGKYQAKVLHHYEHTWPKKLRARLLKVMAPATATTEEICELNVRVAEVFADAAACCIAGSGIAKRKIAAIASHGQTVCHLPRFDSKRKRVTEMGSTLQLGDVSVIAVLTGIMTVGNFRPADMAVGGQGAPLVPFADAALLSDSRVIRCVQNIGGIANVTYLPRSVEGEILAFDTGPGNMVMDAVIVAATAASGEKKLHFDRGGKMAQKGTLQGRLFRELQAHSYFERRPPKSTGREVFGVAFARELMQQNPTIAVPDLLHTLCRWTAWSIVDAYINFLPEPPDEVIVCGGGADNPTLMKMLAEELAELTSAYVKPAPARIRRIEEFSIPNKAKEAASFAILGAATLDGWPGNVTSVTGARRPIVLGVTAHSGNFAAPKS